MVEQHKVMIFLFLFCFLYIDMPNLAHNGAKGSDEIVYKVSINIQQCIGCRKP